MSAIAPAIPAIGVATLGEASASTSPEMESMTATRFATRPPGWLGRALARLPMDCLHDGSLGSSVTGRLSRLAGFMAMRPSAKLCENPRSTLIRIGFRLLAIY